MKLFKINDNGELEISDLALTIVTFKKIIRRDKGSKGDSEGRLKLHAKKELAYIVWMTDPTESPALDAGFEGVKLHNESVRRIGLPFGYKADDLIKEAIAYYKEVLIGSEGELLTTLLGSFKDSTQVAALLKKQMTIILKDIDNLSVEQISTVMEYQKQLLNLVKEVPEAIKTLKDLRANANTEKREMSIARGGNKIVGSMD